MQREVSYTKGAFFVVGALPTMPLVDLVVGATGLDPAQIKNVDTRPGTDTDPDVPADIDGHWVGYDIDPPVVGSIYVVGIDLVDGPTGGPVVVPAPSPPGPTVFSFTASALIASIEEAIAKMKSYPWEDGVYARLVVRAGLGTWNGASGKWRRRILANLGVSTSGGRAGQVGYDRFDELKRVAASDITCPVCRRDIARAKAPGCTAHTVCWANVRDIIAHLDVELRPFQRTLRDEILDELARGDGTLEQLAERLGKPAGSIAPVLACLLGEERVDCGPDGVCRRLVARIAHIFATAVYPRQRKTMLDRVLDELSARPMTVGQLASELETSHGTVENVLYYLLSRGSVVRAEGDAPCWVRKPVGAWV